MWQFNERKRTSIRWPWRSCLAPHVISTAPFSVVARSPPLLQCCHAVSTAPSVLSRGLHRSFSVVARSPPLLQCCHAAPPPLLGDLPHLIVEILYFEPCQGGMAQVLKLIYLGLLLCVLPSSALSRDDPEVESKQ